MKQLLTMSLIAFIFFQSCKKDKISSSNLTGSWTWTWTSTDAAPGPLNPLTPQNSGITQSLNFNENNWVLTKNNLVVSSGTFTTSTEKNITTGQNISCIHYFKKNNPTDSLKYYLVSKDTLFFSNDLIGIIGSGSNLYIKK